MQKEHLRVIGYDMYSAMPNITTLITKRFALHFLLQIDLNIAYFLIPITEKFSHPFISQWS